MVIKMDIEKIGKFIKELRIENGYSQNSLGEKVHVTRQAVSNWENVKSIPDSDILIELSNLFNVSINEILSGSRLDKEDNLEEIALSLVDENNKKRSRIKLLMTSFILTTFILITSFLGYYFITNYNSIKVYKVIGESEHFKTSEGILITTKNKSYIRLGRLIEFNKGIDIQINKMKLYYKDKNNKEYIIFESEKPEVLINDDYGYNEYFIKNNLRKNNNLFLEIEYNNSKCNIIKLKLYPKFKNDLKSINGNNSISVIKDKPDKDIQKSEEELVNKIKTDEIAKTELKLEMREEVKTEEKEINNSSQENIYNNNSEPNSQENIIEDDKPQIAGPNEIEETIEEKFDNIINKIEQAISKMIEVNMYYTIIDNNYIQITYEQNIMYIDIIGKIDITLIQYNNTTKETSFIKLSNGEEINNIIINKDNITEDTLNILYEILEYINNVA